MSDADFAALTAKVRAGAASPDERAAFDKAVVERLFPEIAALTAAAIEEEEHTPAEVLAERVKRGQRMARRAQRREARRLTIEGYSRQLQLTAQVLEVQARREAIQVFAPRRMPTACRRPRSRRARTACRARSPGRLAEDDEPDLAHGCGWSA